MKKFYNTNNFKALQKEWYDKLKSEGFVDIEYGKEDGLLKLEGNFYTLHNKDGKESSYQFYTALSNHINDHEFNNPLEKQVLELIAEGIPYRKIAKQMNISTYKVFNIKEKHKTLILNRNNYEQSS